MTGMKALYNSEENYKLKDIPKWRKIPQTTLIGELEASR